MRTALLEARRAVLVKLESLRTERAQLTAQLEELNGQLAALTGATPKKRVGRPKSAERTRFEERLRALAVNEELDVKRCLATWVQALAAIRELEDTDDTRSFDINEETKIITRVT